MYICVCVNVTDADDEREFDYIKGSNKGPEYWGDLKEEWAACKKGEMQSPIDMSNERVTIVREARDIRRKYFPSPAIIKNRGHDISVCLFFNQKYFLHRQLHALLSFIQPNFWVLTKHYIFMKTTQIQWPDLKAGRIRINGTRYLLQQGHWHSPSEHTINGRRYRIYILLLFDIPFYFVSRIITAICLFQLLDLIWSYTWFT